MKKRFISIFLIFLILTMYTGCEVENQLELTSEAPNINPSTNGISDTDNSIDNLTSTEVTSNSSNEVTFEMPIIDGSTSTIPLEAGIRSSFLNIPPEIAETQVSHTTTHSSFYKLLDGRCDMILSVPLSQTQVDAAAAQGVALEKFPIAMEGFVFVVNADNPIDTLTQQQIKDIYSGKITNWKDLGGNDIDIIAYQRNNDSGSQNYMTAFMGDNALMRPVTKSIPASMSGLMDAISSYDNSSNAIGYSVYSYAAEMYTSANNIKFIKVDGIAPNSETMSDGSYPLLSYNYAVLKADTAVDSPVRTLINWIISDKGQKAVAESGYIPVSDIKTSLEADIIMPLLSDGTGKEKPAGYELPNTYYTVDNYYYLKYDLDSVQHNWRIEGLNNKALQKEINNFINGSIKAAQDETEKATPYAKGSFEYSFSPGIYVDSECINGYLSVIVSLIYEDGSEGSAKYYYKPYTAVWDLYSGIKLSFTDMFWKGIKFVKGINNGISQELQKPYNSWGSNYILLGDFWALPEDFNTFSLNNAYFQSNDGIFRDGIGVNYSSYCENLLVTGQLRDMSGIWEKSVAVRYLYRTYDSISTGIGMEYEDGSSFWEIDAEKSGIKDDVCNKINNYMKKEFNEKLTTQALDNRFGKGNYTQDWPAGSDFLIYDKAYIIFSGTADIYITANNSSKRINICTIFDYKTGENLTIDDIFSDGWRDIIQETYFDNITLDGFIKYSLEGITFGAMNSAGKHTWFTVPYEYYIISNN